MINVEYYEKVLKRCNKEYEKAEMYSKLGDLLYRCRLSGLSVRCYKARNRLVDKNLETLGNTIRMMEGTFNELKKLEEEL